VIWCGGGRGRVNLFSWSSTCTSSPTCHDGPERTTTHYLKTSV